MNQLARELREATETAAARLLAIPSERAGMPPAPGKWSPKEVIGHLIDSASTNHGRFVRAREDAGLSHPGYDQDAWVRAGAYTEAPWEELVELWRLLNRQIARVLEATPNEDLQRERRDHNLDQIAWQAVPAGDPVTLAAFGRDDIGHLRHHLGQIDTGLLDEPT